MHAAQYAALVPTERQTSDLERLAATELAACMAGRPAGAPLPLDSSSELCFVLERLIPALLRSEHPEWRFEGIDGFYFASATKSDRNAARLAGTCILISDQAVTPFMLDFVLADADAFESWRIRVGEQGRGP